MTKRNKRLLIITVTVLTFIAVTLGSMAVATRLIYDGIFNDTYKSDGAGRLDPEYEGLLSRERHSFTTGGGHTLIGYLYESTREMTKHALVIFAHGMGEGQSGYEELYYALAERGYFVFAFDATATGESEGEGAGGFAKTTLDLDYAINYATALEKLKGAIDEYYEEK